VDEFQNSGQRWAFTWFAQDATISTVVPWLYSLCSLAASHLFRLCTDIFPYVPDAQAGCLSEGISVGSKEDIETTYTRARRANKALWIDFSILSLHYLPLLLSMAVCGRPLRAGRDLIPGEGGVRYGSRVYLPIFPKHRTSLPQGSQPHFDRNTQSFRPATDRFGKTRHCTLGNADLLKLLMLLQHDVVQITHSIYSCW
jgi:hypothetical protein